MKKAPLLFVAGSVFLTSCGGKAPSPSVSGPSVSSGMSGGGFLSGNPLMKPEKTEDGMASGLAPKEVGVLPTEVGDGVMAGGMLLYNDDDIVWSTGNPDDDIPFEESFKNQPEKTEPWLSSYREARQESMRSGKPILLWFTRTGSPASPRCAVLKRELFATHEFAKWAKDSVIRLKIDVSGGDREYDENSNISETTTNKRKYAEKLRKQYHVMGYPSVLVLEPNGAVYRRERGYKRGGAKGLWQKLKDAALTIEHNRDVWERKMALKGYREWKGKNDKVVFAKLTRYRKGAIWLIEPDGNLIKTSTRHVSPDDRAWIIAEMEKRGL